MLKRNGDLSTYMGVIDTIKWRINRTLESRYGGYCDHRVRNDFKADILYHLWNDIPSRMALGSTTEININMEYVETSSIDNLCLRIDVIFNTTYVVSRVYSIPNGVGTLSLSQVGW